MANSPIASVLTGNQVVEQIFCPVSKNNGYPGGVRSYEKLGYWPIGLGNTDTYFPSGDAKLFGYLCEVWELLNFGLGYVAGGAQEATPRVGSYFGEYGPSYPIAGKPQVREITAVVVEVWFYPDQADLIFGSPPLINGGYCGFVWQPEPPPSIFLPLEPNPNPEIPPALRAGVDITIGPGQYPLARTKPENINSLSSVFFPPARGCIDFWWHLQEGVRANIYPFFARQLLGATVDYGGVDVPSNPGDGGDCPSYRLGVDTSSPFNGYGESCAPPPT